LRDMADGRFTAYSAGLDPRPVNPLTRRMMDEIGVSLDGQTSKSQGDFLGKVPVRYGIVVCERAKQSCPKR
jgi:arsenate reductase